jgi:Na+/H+ antiporter NhaD/arsenite permease-like protein
MDPVVVSVFLFVYVGMIVGEIPRLRVDRTGFALLGAIALVASGRMTTATAWAAVDVPTLALLFGLMVISAQFRLGGFYAAVTRRLGASQHSPSGLLALVIVAAGGLSAVLANDIVCLAMAPVLIEVCVRRGLDPVPFLLALACAANVGSAATLIGNPQNMLIGQTLQLSFTRYLIEGGVPAVLGLGVVWLVIAFAYRSVWSQPATPLESDPVAFNRWQTNKGLIVMTGVMAAFLFAPWPREVVALAGAGVLMISRRTASRELLSMVDWHLLILFIGLFVVNAAIAQSGLLSGVLMAVRQAGGDLTDPWQLFVASAVLSNFVSNVPAVMLLLPAARSELAGPVLALSSTLAGNLLIVGSIANIIVIEQARRLGVQIDGRTHRRVGVPVTLATLAIAAAWLALLGVSGSSVPESRGSLGS